LRVHFELPSDSTKKANEITEDLDSTKTPFKVSFDPATPESGDLDSDKDFGSGLSFPEQVLASEAISNQVVTPFDCSTIVQML
jgi:hypothetical protein